MHQHNQFAAVDKHMCVAKVKENRLAEVNGEKLPNVRSYLLEYAQSKKIHSTSTQEVTAVYADDKNGPPGWELIMHTPSASL